MIEILVMDEGSSQVPLLSQLLRLCVIVPLDVPVEEGTLDFK